METTAAVLWEYGGDWEVDELTLDDPREGEVLVRLAASGLCHSDEHVRSRRPADGAPCRRSEGTKAPASSNRWAPG